MFRSLAIGCVCALAGSSVWAEDKEIRESGISLHYDEQYFGGHSVKSQPRLTRQENGTDIPVDVGPARISLLFEDKRPLPALEKGPRHFAPTHSTITVIPLTDASVKDYSTSYPAMQAASVALKSLLARHPATPSGKSLQAIDLRCVDESHAIESKVAYHNFPAMAGVSFVTQYTQEEQGNPVNNEELTFVFEGITKDGRYYVDAHFAITMPGLPRGIDYTGGIARDKGNQYLRKAEKRIDAAPAARFTPPLGALLGMLASLSPG